MKKLYALVAILVLSLSLGVTAMAQTRAGKGARKAACSTCRTTCGTPEQIKKFKIDSIDLRQELMTKRFELQRENLKDAPDSQKITAVKADMAALKVKIDALRTANGLKCSTACNQDDCPLMDGSCSNCGNCGPSAAKAAPGCGNCNNRGTAGN